MEMHFCDAVKLIRLCFHMYQFSMLNDQSISKFYTVFYTTFIAA